MTGAGRWGTTSTSSSPAGSGDDVRGAFDSAIAREEKVWEYLEGRRISGVWNSGSSDTAGSNDEGSLKRTEEFELDEDG
jgi:hypothetical protein